MWGTLLHEELCVVSHVRDSAEFFARTPLSITRRALRPPSSRSSSIRPMTPTPRQKIFFERGYQQMSFGSRVPHASKVRPESPARNACATRVPGGLATTEPTRTGSRSSGQNRACPRPRGPRTTPPPRNVRAAGRTGFLDRTRCASARSSATRPRRRDVAACARRRHEARHWRRSRCSRDAPAQRRARRARARGPRMAVLHFDVARDRPHRAAARKLAAREVLARPEGGDVEDRRRPRGSCALRGRSCRRCSRRRRSRTPFRRAT